MLSTPRILLFGAIASPLLLFFIRPELQLPFVPSPVLKQSSQKSKMATAAVNVDRAKGAIMGAVVADAATMGLHWIYDNAKLQGLLNSKGKSQNPEFFEPPSCPFYQMPSGSLSPYGAEVHALLRYLAQPDQQQVISSKAPINGPSWQRSLAAHFKDFYQGYKNHSIKTLIANLDAGKQYPAAGDENDTQADSMCKVPAIAAVYAGTDALPAAVEAAVRAQQNNDTSVKLGLAAARVLEQVVLGASIAEALDWAQQPGNLPDDVAQQVKAAVAVPKDEPFLGVAQKFGVSCSMPGAFQNVLVLALRADSYVDGIRTNLAAGGDNCSRSVYLGALLGAAYGAQSVPQDWRSRVTGWTEMEAAIDKVVA